MTSLILSTALEALGNFGPCPGLQLFTANSRAQYFLHRCSALFQGMTLVRITGTDAVQYAYCRALLGKDWSKHTNLPQTTLSRQKMESWSYLLTSAPYVVAISGLG